MHQRRRTAITEARASNKLPLFFGRLKTFLVLMAFALAGCDSDKSSIRQAPSAAAPSAAAQESDDEDLTPEDLKLLADDVEAHKALATGAIAYRAPLAPEDGSGSRIDRHCAPRRNTRRDP